jgi:hypothetical protein
MIRTASGDCIEMCDPTMATAVEAGPPEIEVTPTMIEAGLIKPRKSQKTASK